MRPVTIENQPDGRLPSGCNRKYGTMLPECVEGKCDRCGICYNQFKAEIDGNGLKVTIKTCLPEAAMMTIPDNILEEISTYKLNDVILATSPAAALAVVHFYRDHKGYSWILLVVDLIKKKIREKKKSLRDNMAIVECHLNAKGNNLVLLCIQQSKYSIVVMYLNNPNLSMDYILQLGTMRTYICPHPYQPLVALSIPVKDNEIKVLQVNIREITDPVKVDLLRHTSGNSSNKNFLSVTYGRNGKRLFVSTIDSIHKRIQVYVVRSEFDPVTRHLTSLSAHATPPRVTVHSSQHVDKCSSNFKMLLSRCGTEIAIPTIYHSFLYNTYKIAEPDTLADHCIISIMHSLKHPGFVRQLPIPEKIQNILLWDNEFA